MPRLLDTDYRAALVAAVFVDLVARDGVTGPSVRALAAGTHVAPSTLLHHLGTQARIRHVVAAVVAQRLEHEAALFVADGEHVGLLPHDRLPGSRDRRRAWAALQTMAFADADVAAVVRRHDLVSLAHAHRLSPLASRPTAGERLDGWGRDTPLRDDEALRLAVVEGLRALCTRRVAPVPVEQAVRILTWLLPPATAPTAPAARTARTGEAA